MVGFFTENLRDSEAGEGVDDGLVGADGGLVLSPSSPPPPEELPLFLVSFLGIRGAIVSECYCMFGLYLLGLIHFNSVCILCFISKFTSS